MDQDVRQPAGLCSGESLSGTVGELAQDRVVRSPAGHDGLQLLDEGLAAGVWHAVSQQGGDEGKCPDLQPDQSLDDLLRLVRGGIESVAARQVPEQETVVLGSDEPGHGCCGQPPQDTCFMCEESRYALQPEPSPAPA